MATPVSNSVSLPAVDGGNGTLTDEFINGLVQGGSWTFAGPRTLTYSLDLNFDGVTQNWPPEWMDAVARALAAWQAVADVKFVLAGTPSALYQNESTADLSIVLAPGEGQGVLLALSVFPDPAFADTLLTALGYTRDSGTYPFPRPEGDTVFDSENAVFSNLDAGGAGFYVLLHEFGHALGLKHTDDDGGNGRPAFAALGLDAYSAPAWTVMEGSDFPSGAFPATPGLLDILAIQHIYGANMSYHAGNNAYALGNASYNAIWDAGGTDVLSAAAWAGTDGVRIDLHEAAFSGDRLGAKRTAIAYGAVIENAIGSDYSDRITGNGGANSLSGRAGDDTLNGGVGADTLVGGAGDDVLFWGPADILRDGGAGADALRLAGAGLTLNLRLVDNARIANVEAIDLTGIGDNRLKLALQDVLDLSSTTDTLRVDGNSGDVVHRGTGWTQGVDQMIGANTYHRYTQGLATLLVDSDITSFIAYA